MMQIEQTYFELAEMCTSNCLIICDRGVMDPSAYMPHQTWDSMMKGENWNPVELRDSRYHQVIHMTTAADGAVEFYTTEDNAVRDEGPELARELDCKVAQAWIGHPYYDVIGNSTDFRTKCMKMIASVCRRIGIDVADRLELNSKKRKFLIASHRPDEEWPVFKEFDVVHDYLTTPHNKMQARLRKRGQNGVYTFTHTVRRPMIKGQRVELRKQISGRTYHMLLEQRDKEHCTIYKKRRCFIYNNKYFQLDIYQEPCHPRCKGLMILETYTGTEAGHIDVPDFLTVSCEVTDQPLYSMYNLCLKDYHQMEVKAGVTQAVTQFDYRQAYADIEADGTESSSMRSNGLH
ncbi:TRPL translocation defect protein 14-like isoform X2 [Watersipora subatra]